MSDAIAWGDSFIHVDLRELRELRTKLLNGLPKGWKVLWGSVSAFLTRDVANIFENEGAYDGHIGWAPLRFSTLRARWRKREMKSGKVSFGSSFGSAKILQDTGTLRNSLGLLTAGESDMTFGTKLNYAAPLFFGVPSKSIPPRQFLWASQDTLDKTANLVGDLIEVKFGEALK